MRLTTDLPDAMHLRAKERAKVLGVTLSKFVTIALEEHMERRSKTRKAAKGGLKRRAKG
jgi:hypothetical protein